MEYFSITTHKGYVLESYKADSKEYKRIIEHFLKGFDDIKVLPDLEFRFLVESLKRHVKQINQSEIYMCRKCQTCGDISIFCRQFNDDAKLVFCTHTYMIHCLIYYEGFLSTIPALQQTIKNEVCEILSSDVAGLVLEYTGEVPEAPLPPLELLVPKHHLG